MLAKINYIILPLQTTYWHLMNYLLFPPVFCLLSPQSPHKTGSLFKFDRNISDRLACHCCFQGWHPIWQIQTDQPFKIRNPLWMVMYIYRWFLSAPIVHILRIKNTLGKGLVINFRGGWGAEPSFMKTSFMWFTLLFLQNNTWPTQFLGKNWSDPPSLSKGMIP